VIIRSELVRARKWSSDRTTTSAWVRAIARKLVIVVVQSGFLLASVQTVTLVLWRVEMSTPNTKGTAYVFFPISILPKLYSVTYLVILLCTPPPGAASQATGSATGSLPAWVADTSSEPGTPVGERKETVIELSNAPTAHQPNFLPQVLGVRPDWISVTQTAEPERTVRSRSWSDSTYVGPLESAASPTTRSRGRFGSVSTLATGSPKQELPMIKVEEAMAPIAEDDVELEYYRSYAAALEASRTPRTVTCEDRSPVATIFPMIDHPYATSVSDRAIKEIAVTGDLGTRWDDTPTVKSAAATDTEFDADDCLAMYKFGTLSVSRNLSRAPPTSEVESPLNLFRPCHTQTEPRLEVPLASKAEELRVKHEFARHARDFMRPSFCSITPSEASGGSGYDGYEEEETMGGSDGLEVQPKLARLESDASFVCASVARRGSGERMAF